MNAILQRVALRAGGLYLPDATVDVITEASAALVASLRKCGYELTEEALHAINSLSDQQVKEIVAVIDNVYGLSLNWASLKKNWMVPTGETWIQHVVAAIANALPDMMVDGVTLPCGHVIPEGLFDLSRYNGCPYCGKPFELAHTVNLGQGSKVKTLRRFTDKDMKSLLSSLLASPVPPDATQLENIVALVGVYGIDEDTKVGNLETRLLLSAHLFDAGKVDEALNLLSTPSQVMRMLWYRRTAKLRIVRPANLKVECKLHYNRAECAAVARWFDTHTGDTARACEDMHPYRGMWVRFIRALRLPEYAKRKKLTVLAELLDRFYRGDYDVAAADLAEARENKDVPETLRLLSNQPSLFARQLFNTILTTGRTATLEAFGKVADKLAPRLMYTLASYADNYFLPSDNTRVVTLADGRRVSVDINPELKRYDESQRAEFAAEIRKLVLDYFRRLYSQRGDEGKKIYIDKELFDIPLSVGDRSTTVQDASSALPGQRFRIEGDAVRLFLQWGEGLPAQHLDMDLSAKLIQKGDANLDCAYYSLYQPGATHSGDIQYIPDNVGTAEYIELELPKLRENGTRYVIFECNAYSCPDLALNLKVGWMDSSQPMKVDDSTGVAYDPSTVGHMVRVAQEKIARGLVFGILDVDAGEITWLEMPNGTQRLDQLDAGAVTAYLNKLRAKISIGELLTVYASQRGRSEVAFKEDADMVFDLSWARNPAAVAGLLL